MPGLHIRLPDARVGSLGPEEFRKSRAPLVLGSGHPLSRTAMFVHAVTRQLAVTSGMVVLGVVIVAERRSWGVRVLNASLVVELTLLLILALARQVRREHVLRLLASGRLPLTVEEVSREARRLATRRHSDELARRLERALDEATRWHQLAVASRPPPGIKRLSAFAPEVHAIVELLQGGEAGLPGLALLELCLIGGFGSAVYAGDPRALREQLWRIRHLLNQARAEDVEHASR